MLEEYRSIAQAHFNTNSAISAFFKSYLAIVGLPLPVAGVLLTYLSRNDSGAVALERFSAVVLGFSLAIAIVGYLVMVYIANLRFDALLYARTVNGIRRYFYDTNRLPLEEELAVRILPRSTRIPPFYERHFFWHVAVVFAFLDWLYPWCGIKVFCDYPPFPLPLWSKVVLYVSTAVFGLLHVARYWELARFREHLYLRPAAIGVDIDGVLSKHREQFAAILLKNCNKEIDPEKIDSIPVEQCRSFSVTSAETSAVFNDPEYWRGMIAADDAAEVMRRLKEHFGFEVYVFTHREWPNFGNLPGDRLAEYEGKWRHIGIKELTTDWLSKNRIPADAVILETGNVHTVDVFRPMQNRFSATAIARCFVEDDIPKARKLARLCDVVFLMDHPYNKCDESELPNNVVSVSSWQQIEAFFRQHL